MDRRDLLKSLCGLPVLALAPVAELLAEERKYPHQEDLPVSSLRNAPAYMTDVEWKDYCEDQCLDGFEAFQKRHPQPLYIHDYELRRRRCVLEVIEIKDR